MEKDFYCSLGEKEISDAEVLERMLYFYANYEEQQSIANSTGAFMKESKESYGESVLSILQKMLKGKDRSTIRYLVQSFVEAVKEFEE